MFYNAFLIVLIFSNPLDNEWKPNLPEDIVVILPYLTSSPTIDGYVDDDEYTSAKRLRNFTEFLPDENTEPPVKTEVFVGFDDKYLYIAFKCYENDMSKVRANFTERDKLFGDDAVIVYLDTYGDLKDAYIFATNPKGVQMDGIRKKDEGGEDYSYDTEWMVASRIEDSCWIAEFRIPFSSLNFSKKPLKTWKVELLRVRPRETMEMYAWAPLSQNIPGMLSQSGTFIINKPIHSRHKYITFIPYLSASQEGYRGTNGYNEDKVYYKSGVSLRYNPFSNLGIDAAINPDFAEIEADAPQLDVNTPFAIYYTEKRPFFQEGKSILETPLDLIYTRTINNPIYALKVSGNLMGNNFVLLSAKDNNTPWIIPFEDLTRVIYSDKTSYSNLIRGERNISEHMQMGIIVGNRKEEDGYNTIYSLDARNKFFNHLIITYQGAYSKTKEPSDSSLTPGFNSISFDEYTGKFDGELFEGYAHYLKSDIYFKYLSAGVTYHILSPAFRSNLGFISQNNLKRNSFYISPKVRPNRYGFNEVDLYIDYLIERNFNNVKKRDEISVSLQANLIKQTSVSLSYNKGGTRYFEEYFSNLWDYTINLSTRPIKYISLNSYFSIGKTINYSELSYGYERNLYLYTVLTPFPFARFEISYQRYWLFRKMWEDNVFDITLLYGKMEYFFSRLFSVRFCLDYNRLSKQLDIMPLVKYQPSPFSVFFIGLNSSIFYARYNDFEIQSHQLFFKIQYRFNL